MTVERGAAVSRPRTGGSPRAANRFPRTASYFERRRRCDELAEAREEFLELLANTLVDERAIAVEHFARARHL